MKNGDPCRDLAERLLGARRAGTTIPREGLPPGLDLAGAYRCQRAMREIALAAGARHAGWKIGVTSAAARRAMGVAHPVTGFLTADLISEPTAEGDAVPVFASGLLAEAEVAYELGADLPPGTTPDLVRASARPRLAVEFVASRWEGGAGTATPLVADNVSHVAVVLGPVVRATDLTGLRATLSCADRTSAGGSDQVLGDPAAAVAWAAAHLAALGHPLRRGDLIMTGTLCPPLPAPPGGTVTATLDGLAHLKVTTG
ncbi:fumarylacetoacetate hydrolase family protein [Spongiactinospora sp. TRM90649]|uniref:2-keto-4-pentenoate hydratase n=1 Tax=Spongiactinospora sp. TRM90649 TaxID=3031114 RepID=UPI0023F734AC|nr:fumarylacetoacetate hydrolase family protein [Spongiactinospora sp. TRM90649]MDF5754517.1 2-keto-4-pentenoate hydratase [Spongiactinospora sp. TRM90649]